jgi:3-methyladenine DNA glycosylase AlkC
LDGLELKARVLKVTAELKKNLPENYPVALSILVKTMESDQLSGFDLWPFSEYIGQFGLEHFEESLHAMTVLTERFTSEFAVRPFFLKDHARVLKFFSNHVGHKNHHVRRWISEGSRPLLPWGERLPQFVADPTPTLQLLESLKFDEELYVRKSVANHINDISKHHPELVIQTIGRWVRTSPPEHLDKIQWIKRQGLRTLIKKGNLDALKLMGVTGKAKIKAGRIKLNQKQFRLNDRLEFVIELQSTGKQSQRLIVDYLIDFQKANGKKGSKVFKLKMIEINTGEKILIRKVHHLRKISTMTYHKGPHQVMIQVNGEIIASAVWQFHP